MTESALTFRSGESLRPDPVGEGQPCTFGSGLHQVPLVGSCAYPKDFAPRILAGWSSSALGFVAHAGENNRPQESLTEQHFRGHNKHMLDDAKDRPFRIEYKAGRGWLLVRRFATEEAACLALDVVADDMPGVTLRLAGPDVNGEPAVLALRVRAATS